MVSLNELRYIAIDVFNDLKHPIVALFCIIPFIDDQSVDFVEHQNSLNFSLPSLANDRRRLRADTLNAINHDDSAVREADS